MKTIAITNDEYRLVIYSAEGWMTFAIINPEEHETINSIKVWLPNDTIPEVWLLELAEGNIIRDRGGRRIRIDSGSISFNIDAAFAPELPYTYYGLTTNEITTAIKSALAPEPEMDWPDYILEGTRMIYSSSWCDWILSGKDKNNIRLEQIEQVIKLKLVTDHLDKNKVYVKGNK